MNPCDFLDLVGFELEARGKDNPFRVPLIDEY